MPERKAPDRILRFAELSRKVGLGRTAVYAEIDAGKFPRPVKLTERATGWRESEVDAWIAAREQTKPRPKKEAA
jgi:prophage regulatory protein